MNTQDNDSPVKDSDPVTRVRLLATAAKFSAILAVLGVSSSILAPVANAHDTGPKNNELKEVGLNVEALKKLLEHAISSGNMDEAISKFGRDAGLNAAQTETLKGLTKEELKDLDAIQKKLNSSESAQFKGRRG